MRSFQYSFAMVRSSWPRSCASPPRRPAVWAARIVPVVGRLARSTWRRRIPQLRAHDRLGALIEHLLDRDHDHAAGRLAVDHEAREQVRIDRERGAAHHPDGLADAGDQEQEGDARIAHDVAQAVDAVVAAAVGHHQGLSVAPPARSPARRRAASNRGPRARGRERKERRRLDEGAVVIADVIDLLGDRDVGGRVVERRELVQGGDEMAVAWRHGAPPRVRASIYRILTTANRNSVA